jgi:hypothetical protein
MESGWKRLDIVLMAQIKECVFVATGRMISFGIGADVPIKNVVVSSGPIPVEVVRHECRGVDGRIAGSVEFEHSVESYPVGIAIEFEDGASDSRVVADFAEDRIYDCLKRNF